MYSEIVHNLRLSNITCNKFIIVTKDVTSDVNFVFCELLSHYINKNYTVVLLNFSQSYAHYNHMLLKSGVNVRQLKEKQQILAIDGLFEIENLTKIEADNINQNTAFRDLFSGSGSDDSMQSLFNLINKTVQKLASESKQFILFIDDVSTLLNLGINVTRIFSFIQYCRSLCFKDKNAQNVLLVGSVYEKEDLLSKKQNDYFLHIADVKIQVEGLKTGYSKDVHGKVHFCIFIFF